MVMTKGSDDIHSGEDRSKQGKYDNITFGFEMDGHWYMPYKEEMYGFNLQMSGFLRSYHKQPYDFGQYLRKV
jgi:hypothetical protein